MPVIDPGEGQDVGELARTLLAIAEAESLDGPVTVTHGARLGFQVSDELLASYEGAPAQGVENDDDESGKPRRGRKKSKGE